MELLRRRSTGHPTLRRLGSALIGAGLLAALVAPASAFAASPVVGNVTLEVAEDSGPTAGNFLVNATDADLDDLDVTSYNAAALIAAGAGTLTGVSGETGAFTFTPAANYSGGPINVTFSVSDGSSPLVTATLAITVTSEPDPPTAVDDTVVVLEDTATDVAAAVLDNDSDMEGDDIELSGASNATGGTIDLTGAVLTFTPDADLCGVGAGGFDYEITDGILTDTAHATVNITCVNDAGPVAVDDTVTVVEDTATDVTDDILVNDTDVDNDDLAVTAVANPTGGTVAVVAGVVTFTPTANLCGAGAGGFDYTVSDGTVTDTGAVIVDITCVNDAPVAPDDSVSGTEDTEVQIPVADLVANGTDAENDTITLDSVGNALQGIVFVIGETVHFAPVADFCGAAAFDYVLTDGTADSDPGTVTVNIACVNDGGPVAVDDTVTVVEDTATDVTAAILGNDTDVDDDDLAVTAVANPTGGTVAVVAGVVTFTPTAQLCGVGAGSFDYTVSDGTVTDTGAVTVDITCVNDLPVAVDDTVTVVEDTATNVTAAIKANDTDNDAADTLTVTAVANPTGGTVAVEAGVVTFTPTANLCGAGEGSFDYTLSDGTATDTASVTVNLTCVNDAPVAVDDEGTAAYQTAADFDVLDNDTDVDSASLTVVSPDVDPAKGTVSVVANQVHFVPAAGVTGEVEITYTVSDGALTDEGLLTVTVLVDAIDPVPATPGIAFGTGRVDETAPLAISWSATDTNGTGVASYEVQVKVGSADWAAFYTGTDTTKTAFYAFGTELKWRVRATDVASNVSDWVESPVRKMVAYQGGSPVTYTGTWTKVDKAAASGSGYRYTTSEGKKAKLTFTGFGVMYVAPKLSSGGYAKVNINGTATRVRLKADTTTHGVIIKSQLWGSSAERTIKVINDQGGKRTTFDVFVVLQ